MNKEQVAEIMRRWDGVTQGYKKLTFEEAKADMDALAAEAQKVEPLRAKVAELELHIKKRNNDMQAFATEVARLANQKYADYLQTASTAAQGKN